jgi:glycosyl transferase family 11
MVVFYSMGGLGNQMFQYATARGLARRLGIDVGADTSWHGRTLPDTTPRPFVLPRLNVQLRALSMRERFWARIASDRILGRFPLLPWAVRRERDFSYDPSIARSGDRTYLFGYWQSPRYFEDARDTLVPELLPRAPPSDADRRVIESMRGCESVFVHVRRGDYVSLAAAAANHGTCSVEYYRAAFDVVAGAVRAPVLFVFSDDPAWARENLKFPAPTVYVDHNSPGDAEQDLRLMASCRHAIIANSSFSWWGAWLGDQEGRVVVAPRRWFADGRPTPDLLPPTWRVI